MESARKRGNPQGAQSMRKGTSRRKASWKATSYRQNSEHSWESREFVVTRRNGEAGENIVGMGEPLWYAVKPSENMCNLVELGGIVRKCENNADELQKS